MKIINIGYPLTDYQQQVKQTLQGRNCALAIGNFDGVHVAHQEILRLAKQTASQQNAVCAALTFEPHPKLLFNQEPHYLLTNLSNKLTLLERCGIDLAVVIHFSHEFSCISAEDFIQQVLVDMLSAKSVVTGYDFCFGSKRSGNASMLAESAPRLGFSYNQVRQISYEGMEVSSSHIKKLLNSGLIALANDLLGRQYSIQGQPASEQPRAISITLANALHYPASGMYLCRTRHQSHWHYMLGTLSVVDNQLTLLGLDSTGHEWVALVSEVGDANIEILEIEVLQLLRPARQMADQAMAQLQHAIDLRDANYVHIMCYKQNKK
ncbi:MAG: hypothetical protein JSS50_04135 [Proteobacteria bacterium]|nr:hypothetical protein [Pseudomonadota bacterium]